MNTWSDNRPLLGDTLCWENAEKCAGWGHCGFRFLPQAAYLGMPGNSTSWLGQLPSASFVYSSKPSLPREVLSSLVLSSRFIFHTATRMFFFKKKTQILSCCYLSSFIHLLIHCCWVSCTKNHVKPWENSSKLHLPLREERPQQCDRKPWGVSVGNCSRVHAGPAVVGVFQAYGAEAMNLTRVRASGVVGWGCRTRARLWGRTCGM